MRPDVKASELPQLSWSHILAMVTGPLESLQLSAVVMYFFATSSSSSSSNETHMFRDDFSSTVMMWGTSGGHLQGYYIASSVACLLVLLWIMLVSIPMAMSGERDTRWVEYSR